MPDKNKRKLHVLYEDLCLTNDKLIEFIFSNIKLIAKTFTKASKEHKELRKVEFIVRYIDMEEHNGV